jgi:hypothetical protein
MDSDYPADGPQVNPLLDPSNRDGIDYFTNWRNNGVGTLLASGESSYFRFDGETSVGTVNGKSLVYMDVTDGEWASVISDFWSVPLSVGGLFDDTATTDIKQDWVILEENGPWIKSEDTGKAIPEPLTALLLGLGGLALIRCRTKI